MIWQTMCYNTVISLRMFLGFSEMGHIVHDYHSHYRRQRLYKTCKTNKTNTYNWSGEFWSSSHECSLIKKASEKWWIWKTGDRSDINTVLSTLECHHKVPITTTLPALTWWGGPHSYYSRISFVEHLRLN